MPGPRPETQISPPLQENVQNLDDRMTDAKITDEQLAKAKRTCIFPQLSNRNKVLRNMPKLLQPHSVQRKLRYWKALKLMHMEPR